MPDGPSRSTVFYVLASSVLILAVALFYFALTLKKVSDGLPPVVAGLQEVSGDISPILERVDEVTEMLPSVLEEVANIRLEVEQVRESIPALLAEAAAYRETIPSVLAEIEEVRGTIPPILERVESIQAQIPVILAEVEAVRGEVPAIIEQVEAVQIQIPAILAEVEAVRIAVPEYIDEAIMLTDGIRTAGKEAAEGAAQGFFTGIIKAPVNMVSGLGSNVFGSVQVSQKVRVQFRDKISELLGTPEMGEMLSWKDSETGYVFEVEITRLRGSPGSRAVTIEARAVDGKQVVESATLKANEKSSGAWDTALQK